MTLLTNNTLDSATIEDQSCDYELVTTSLGRPDCRIGTRPVAGAQDTPAMSTSLSAYVKLLEVKLDTMPTTKLMELARHNFDEMATHARKTVYYAVHFGTILRRLFKEKNQQEQESICQEITGRSLESGRRYVKLVDNLPLIEQRLNEDDLMLEETSVTKLLGYIPKQEGKGGRPKKAKATGGHTAKLAAR